MLTIEPAACDGPEMKRAAVLTVLVLGCGAVEQPAVDSGTGTGDGGTGDGGTGDGDGGVGVDAGVGIDGGLDCTGVAPTTPTRQTAGQWYLNQINQGTTNFADYLYPFSDRGSAGTTPWPGTQPNGGRTLMINAGAYVALEFNTGDWATARIGGYTVSMAGFSAAPYYMTITECPGDFRTSMIDDKCEMGPTGKGGLYWLMGGTSTFRCVLEQNKTYYLNMVSADPSNLTASFCANSSCGILVFPGF